MSFNAEVSSDAELALRKLSVLTREAGDPAPVLISVPPIVEGFVDDLLSRLIDSSGATETEFGQELVKRAGDSFSQSWAQRHDWLSKGFGVQVTGGAQWQNFEAVIEARNAFLHGNGLLTVRQTRNATSALDLRRRIARVLEAQVEGRRILLSSNSAKNAVVTATAYVGLLDQAVRLLHTAADHPDASRDSVPWA